MGKLGHVVGEVLARGGLAGWGNGGGGGGGHCARPAHTSICGKGRGPGGVMRFRGARVHKCF